MKSVTRPAVHPEWLFGRNPGAIEDQEAQGQASLIESEVLPSEMRPGVADEIIAAGGSIGAVGA